MSPGWRNGLARIAAETGRARAAGWTVDIGREIQPEDPLARVLAQIMAADTRAMHDTAALLGDAGAGEQQRGAHSTRDRAAERRAPE